MSAYRVVALSVVFLLSTACRDTTTVANVRADDASPTATTATTNEVSKPEIDASPVSVACANDAECAWDDHCMPTRCVAKTKANASVKCEESMPPPGTCGCRNGVCTLKPKTLPFVAKSPASCTSRSDCLFDPGGGVCRAGKDVRQGPIEREGPFCSCASTCRLEWVEPVPCTATKDCGYLSDPLRPVPSSIAPRSTPGPIKSCAEGSRDSICDPTTKTCRVVVLSC